MELQTVEIPRARAREEAAEYLRAAKRITDPDRRREFEKIARAYRIAARDEVALIALTPTIAAGGTTTRTRVYSKGTTHEMRQHWLLPELAVAPANANFVYTRGVQRDGSIEFVDRPSPRQNFRKGVVALETRFELPDGFERGQSMLGSWYSGGGWKAMVPIVPPKHRPGNATTLASYLILWDVDRWEWSALPQPPRDPALLSHVGGDIYAVLKTWDLTDLERLVLSGRREETIL